MNTIKYSTQSFLFILCCLFALTSVSTSFAEENNLAAQYYEKAVMAYHDNNIKAVLIELKNSIQQNPENLPAHILLAKAYLQDKNLVATEIALAEADKLGAEPALLVITQAQLYLYQLKFERLLEQINPEDYSKNLQAKLYLYRGDAYVQLNKLAFALNEYKSASVLDKTREEPYVGRANVLLRLGNFKGAEESAKKAIALNSDSAKSFYIKGLLNHAQKKLEQALADYTQAIEKDPEHLDARIARAGVLIDLQRDREAEADLLYLRKTYPFYAKAAYLHALLLSRNQRDQEATEALQAAANALHKIKPEFINKHAPSLLLAGLVNYNLHRFDQALPYLKAYNLKFPGNPNLYRMIGTILLSKKDYEKVIDLLKPMSILLSKDYQALLVLSKAYVATGQYDKADALLSKISKPNLKDSAILTELGLVRLSMGQDDLAIQNLQDVLNADDGNIKAGIPLATLYLKQSQTEKALQIAQTLSHRSPDNPGLLNLLGQIQVKTGQLIIARQSYEKALKLNPEFMATSINLSELDAIENKVSDAIQRLQTLSANYPENSSLAVALAKILAFNKQFDRATKLLNQTVKLEPESLPVRLALIDVKLQQGRGSEALLLTQDAQSHFRENLQLLERLARSYIATDNQGKAKGTLQNMARTAGFKAPVLYSIAMKQVALSDYTSAIKTLKKAVNGNENFIPARIALAEVELKHGNAIFTLNQANYLIKHYPEKADGYRLKADVLLSENKPLAAVEAYQSALSKQSDTFHLMKLYTALKQAGKDGKALGLIKQWVRKHDTDFLPMQALAEEYLIKGQFEESRKYYEQLIKHNDKRADLLNNLAYIYFKTADKRALNFAQKAQKLAPDMPSANDTLGWILVNQGKPKQGLLYLRNAQARTSANPETDYHIAVALHLLQRNDEAKSLLIRIFDNDLYFPAKEDARKLLHQLGN